MRRVEALDSRVNDNIDKTDAVITKLRTLDLKLFNAYPIMSTETIRAARITENKSQDHTENSKCPIYRIHLNYTNYTLLFRLLRFPLLYTQ